MKKKVLITCAVVLGVLLAVYLGFAFYFSSHYLFNTKINSVKYAGKTAKEALEKNTALSRDYLLTITDRKGNSFSFSPTTSSMISLQVSSFFTRPAL